MRASARRAPSATSAGGSATSPVPSRRQATSRSTLMRPMSGQTGRGAGKWRRLPVPAQRRSSSPRTPSTVRMTRSRASDAAARSMICEVEPAKSASARTSSGHSGCASTSAPGSSERSRSTSEAEMAWWMGQKPSFRITFFSPACRATKRPRWRSGTKSTLRCGSARTIRTALEDVTHTSDHDLASAVELT